MILPVLQTIAWLSFSILVLFYLTYLLVLYSYHRKKGDPAGSPAESQPSVSMIVPVYNEEKIISKKIQNIAELRYPKGKLEAIFVDGCSTDHTAEIIEGYSRDHDGRIKLLKEAQRGGYNSAISEGVRKSRGDIVVLSDSGSYYDPDAVGFLVGHFADPEVGAATGKEIVLGNPGALGPRLEATYRGFYDFMRAAETQMDSTPDAKGEILAVRRKICEDLTERIHLSPSASFDCCVPYQAKLAGYRTVFEPRATYHEYAPATFMDRMRQQTRRAAILIGSLLLFRNIMMNRKCGKFGLIIAPVHFVLQVLLPWVFILGCASLLATTFLDPAGALVLWVILLSMAALLTLKDRAFVLSFAQSQLALAIATVRVVARQNSTMIDTIPSTRQ